MSILKRVSTALERQFHANPYLLAFAAKKPDCDSADGKTGGGKSGAGGPPFPVHEGFLRLKQKQAEFSRPDGKPIWQKRPTDLMVFGTTWALAAVGLYMQFEMIYTMAVPKG